MNPETERQQVLFLWLDDSNLAGRVIAWTFHDGSGTTDDLVGTDGAPPYARGTDALADGWRLLQVSPLLPPAPGAEHTVSYLKHEFLFERIVAR